MIKIIEKEVKIVKEYDVEPKIVTLYYVNPLKKDIVECKNCIFKEATPVGWGATDDNDYWLEYENGTSFGTLFRNVIIDITTGKVKDDSEYFFEYEQAVKIHRERRIEYLRARIDENENRIKFLEEDRKELEELEKEDKRDERKA